MRHLVAVDSNGKLSGVVTMSNFLASLSAEHFTNLQNISDILEPLACTITPETLLKEAIQFMQKHRHALVALEGNKPVGILTSRSITKMHLTLSTTDIERISVRDVMNHNINTIDHQKFVPEASNLMKTRKTRHLIAIDKQGCFIGLVTIGNVTKSMEGQYVAFMRTVIQDMECDLLQAQGEQKALFERNPNAVFSLDIAGNILHINNACIAMTGYSISEMRGKAIKDKLTHTSEINIEHILQSIAQKNTESIYTSMLAKDGHSLHIFMSFVPIYISHKVTGIYAVAYNITERVLAEHRLKNTALAFEQADKSIAITDYLGTIQFANKQMHQLFQYETDTLIGVRLSSTESNDGNLYTTDVFPTASKGIVYKGDILHQTQTGKNLDLKVSCSPVHIPGENKVSYFILFFEDLSLKKALENQLRHAQKMETMGTIVSGISHDFNNYLAAISGSLQLLKGRLSNQPELIEEIDALDVLTDNTASLISQLMMFSRKGHTELKAISLSKLIKDSKRLCRLLTPQVISLHWHIEKNIHIKGNYSQIQQLLLNFVKNASDALKNQTVQPSITITLNTHASEADITQHIKSNAKPTACLTVSDNGCGISAQNQERIFDPFFTTKGIGHGTGLGLATSFTTVQNHHGMINVLSEEGKYTSFNVLLPTIEQPKKVKDIPKNIEEKTCILLVDDDDSVRNISKQMLEVMGHLVITASSGKEAIQKISDYDEISLIMMDVMMPNMSGIEAAQSIRSVRPNMPIIFITGYNKNDFSQKISSEEGIHIETKPWKIQTIQPIITKMIAK